MTPIEIAKQILANAKGSPGTTAAAMVALALLGAGKLMAEHQVEPWGTAIAGLGAMIVLVLGFVAVDPKKLPPKDPPQ